MVNIYSEPILDVSKNLVQWFGQPTDTAIIDICILFSYLFLFVFCLSIFRTTIQKMEIGINILFVWLYKFYSALVLKPERWFIMENSVTILSSAASGVTALAKGIFDVVTAAVSNASMIELIGLGVAFAVVGYGISLLPRFRG